MIVIWVGSKGSLYRYARVKEGGNVSRKWPKQIWLVKHGASHLNLSPYTSRFKNSIEYVMKVEKGERLTLEISPG